MGSKTFLFLGLFLAIFFMISSEVIARELAETSNYNENEVHVVGHGGYNGVSGDGHHGCHYGCCGKYKYGCKKCCSYAGEAMDKVTEAQPHN
ncbi:glycine-rich protein-like isoform X2 [Lycium ferocissimum]|uniref:glycine-rich protein-like isoform X2 n=1 Tax=Lycium ferocissimum TaxID=112874 RepID=UPI0028150AB0|nr:glycine-rich protein-like isoform X2 [Lycium ferocissimum]